MIPILLFLISQQYTENYIYNKSFIVAQNALRANIIVGVGLINQTSYTTQYILNRCFIPAQNALRMSAPGPVPSARRADSLLHGGLYWPGDSFLINVGDTARYLKITKIMVDSLDAGATGSISMLDTAKFLGGTIIKPNGILMGLGDSSVMTDATGESLIIYKSSTYAVFASKDQFSFETSVGSTMFSLGTTNYTNRDFRPGSDTLYHSGSTLARWKESHAARYIATSPDKGESLAISMSDTAAIYNSTAQHRHSFNGTVQAESIRVVVGKFFWNPTFSRIEATHWFVAPCMSCSYFEGFGYWRVGTVGAKFVMQSLARDTMVILSYGIGDTNLLLIDSTRRIGIYNGARVYSDSFYNTGCLTKWRSTTDTTFVHPTSVRSDSGIFVVCSTTTVKAESICIGGHHPSGLGGKLNIINGPLVLSNTYGIVGINAAGNNNTTLLRVGPDDNAQLYSFSGNNVDIYAGATKKWSFTSTGRCSTTSAGGTLKSDSVYSKYCFVDSTIKDSILISLTEDTIIRTWFTPSTIIQLQAKTAGLTVHTLGFRNSTGNGDSIYVNSGPDALNNIIYFWNVLKLQ